MEIYLTKNEVELALREFVEKYSGLKVDQVLLGSKFDPYEEVTLIVSVGKKETAIPAGPITREGRM